MTPAPHERFGTAPRDWWRVRRRRLLELWGAGVIASLLVSGASALGYLESLQARTLDLLQWLGGRRFPLEVVIVAIDEAAFEALGGRQPLSRDYLARVIRGVQRAGAAVVGLDVTLSLATTPAEDAALAQAILDFSRDGVSRVVLVAATPEAGPLADAAFLRAVVRGSDQMPVDPDGVIRRAALLLPQATGPPVPALALAVLAHVDAKAPETIEASLRTPESPLSLPVWRPDGSWDLAGSPPLALRTGELWRINFVGPAMSFLTIASGAIVPFGDPGSGPAEIAADNPLRRRIVLIGATFRDSRDFVQTPYGRMPGVEVHANLLHMLATRGFVRPVSWLTSLGIQLAVIVVVGLTLVLLRPLRGTVVALGLTLAVGVPASYLALHGGGYAVDFLLPVLVTCALGVAAEALARRRFRDSFSRYVGREVMEQVLAENPTLRGDRREVSILVSDLRGFTTLSETLPVEAVAAHLNEYFPAMLGAIFAHRGMVNDFIGDGILAVFGAPLHDPGHAWQAARAAVAMQQALEQLNRNWEARGLPTLRMGIGVHTGVVFAGNVGSAERVKYTVVGDPVNMTARLEGLNKELGTSTLLTDETRRALGDRVETRYCGEVPVKGRVEPLRVHELLAVHADGEPRPGARS